MSLFANYRADRLIAEVKSSGNPGSPLAQKALEKLVALGPSAIEPIVDALTTAEKRETLAYVEALSRLIDVKSLPQLFQDHGRGQWAGDVRIAWALSSSKNYPASALLDALTKPSMPKQAILDVIAAQKTRFTVRELLNAAYNQEPNERSGLFKIVAEIADESSIDDLIARIEGKDPVARLHIINVLARFNTPKVRQAVQKQLKDNSKFIRSAALSALSRMDGPFDMTVLCGMLRDPEIEVQNKAVDVVVHANHPETVKYLVEVLKDENEYARRAAVEVLNVVGTSKSVKYLLEVIADSDWWVRTRAADALGKIGGPKVVDAVLTLVKDDNQDIRRAAIEILNQTKDERAVAQLIEATKDPDWWVSERAVMRSPRSAAPNPCRASSKCWGRGNPSPCRPLFVPSARSATRSASSTCCPCCSGRKTKSRWRPSPRWPSSRTNAAPTRSGCGLQAVSSTPTRPSVRPWPAP